MEKVQKKMGRPPIENAKNERIAIRVTSEQKNAIQILAEKKGLTVSELILKTFKLIK